MKTLIIYDNEGYLISSYSFGHDIRIPVGVPHLVFEMPTGKQLKVENGICVDISVTPHQAILEDIPPSEIKILNDKLDNALLELTTLIAMGGM